MDIVAAAASDDDDAAGCGVGDIAVGLYYQSFDCFSQQENYPTNETTTTLTDKTPIVMMIKMIMDDEAKTATEKINRSKEALKIFSNSA